MGKYWRLQIRRRRTPTILLLIVAILSFRKSNAQYLLPPEIAERGWIPRHQSDIAERDSQSSTSTSLWLVSHTDFCLFGPPDPFQYIWNSGLDVVSWCTSASHGTRLIPDGTLHGVTYVKTKDYVQVSGNGDFTKINIAPGDQGGQFDSSQHTPSGASLTVANDAQAASWVTLISAYTFCVRACTGDPKYCPTDYDQMGCWFLTGNSVGDDGVWQDCQSDDGDPPGIFSGSTYVQGASPTPTPTAASLSSCTTGSSVSNGQNPPPLFSWAGTGTAIPLTNINGSPMTTTPSSLATSPATGGGTTGGGGVSTTWIAVNTCIPCSSTSSTSSSFSSSSSSASATSGSGMTTQVGVTQLSTGDVALYNLGTESSTSSAPTLMPISATSTTSLNDVLQRRDGSTTTSNGQCCFTTWTPSIVSNTILSSASSATSSGGSLVIPVNPSTTSGTSSTKSASSTGTRSGLSLTGTGGSNTASANTTLKSGNSSINGTNSSSDALSVRIVGISEGAGGLWRVLMGCVVGILGGLAVGGWVLV